MNIVTEKWQMIDFATKHGCEVRNDKGEIVRVGDQYPDAVKCYTSFPYYYLSSAENQVLLFNGTTYDEWHSNHVFEIN